MDANDKSLTWIKFERHYLDIFCALSPDPRYRSPERSRRRNDFLSGDNPMGISRPAQATVIYPARGGRGGSGKVAASATTAVENDISDVILRGKREGFGRLTIQTFHVG